MIGNDKDAAVKDILYCKGFGEKMVRVRLRKMSEKEFEAFAEYSEKDYANDLMKSSEMPAEEAQRQAKKEFSELLPDGADTKDHSLRVIEDTTDGRATGVIWYLFEMTDGVKQVFLNDFVIREEERRKGYATAALAEMEQDALRNGCMESIIYVWKHNLPGVKLYTKCGYVPFRDVNDGMYLKKQLHAG